MQDITQIITIIVNFLFCGGVISWVTLKDKKMQEREATKQKEEDTRKSRIDTEVKQFEYLSERVKFAEEHIVTLHKKMTVMQQTINNLVSRTLFAETHICLREGCNERHPALGTFCNKFKKMKHFTMSELTYSRTAQILHIQNIPSDEAKENLVALVDNVLDKARDAWGKPVKVNSGYRCPELNKAVGGVSNSQHLTGEAADISTGTKEGNKWLFNYIKDNCVYDQLINEQNYSWVHVSYKRNGANHRDVLHR